MWLRPVETSGQIHSDDMKAQRRRQSAPAAVMVEGSGEVGLWRGESVTVQQDSNACTKSQTWDQGVKSLQNRKLTWTGV